MLIPGKRNKKRIEGIESWAEHLLWTAKLLQRDTETGVKNHIDHLEGLPRLCDGIKMEVEKILAEKQVREAVE